MPNYYAQATVAPLSGETADASVNIFAAASEVAMTGADANDWNDLIAAFYDDVELLGGMLGSAQNGHVTKFLSAVTTTPNYPLFERTFNLNVNPGPIVLPREVSLCVSYQNDGHTEVPRARRRGRIYLSGWAAATNEFGRPTGPTYDGLAEAYQTYAEALNTTTPLTACVWSRVGGTLYPLDRCWSDNEWDTMRSRGGKSTARGDRIIL